MESRISSFSEFETGEEFSQIASRCTGSTTSEEVEVTSFFNDIGRVKDHLNRPAILDKKIWTSSNLVIRYPFRCRQPFTGNCTDLYCRMAYQKEETSYTLGDILDLIEEYADSSFLPGEAKYITSMLKDEWSKSPCGPFYKIVTLEGEKIEDILARGRSDSMWGIEGRVFLQAQRDTDGCEYLKLFSKSSPDTEKELLDYMYRALSELLYTQFEYDDKYPLEYVTCKYDPPYLEPLPDYIVDMVKKQTQAALAAKDDGSNHCTLDNKDESHSLEPKNLQLLKEESQEIQKDPFIFIAPLD